MKKFLSVLIAFVCVIACTFSLAACGDNGDGGTHTKHNWSTTYTNDGDRHYQTCDGCDEKQYSDHDFSSGVCVCGKTQPNEHTSHNWSKTYTPDDTRNQHYQTCDGCDEKQYSDHDYGTDDTCVCGKKKPVTTVEATGVTLDKTEIELEIGDTETLTATVAPEDATDKSVTYSVEPAGVVSVDDDGNVTALDEGTAVITATTSNGKTATCNVTVTKPLTNAEVLEYLNDNILNEVAKKFADAYFVEFNSDNVSNVNWYITKDGDSVTEANVIFNYLRNANSSYVNLYKVTFATPLTPQDIRAGEIGKPAYTQIYTSDSVKPTIQDEHTDLTNTICDLLFGVKENATRYIIENGRNDLDTQMGDVAMFDVIEVTDTDIKYQGIKIKYANNDNALIENLNDKANYLTIYDVKIYTITGVKLENNSGKF